MRATGPSSSLFESLGPTPPLTAGKLLHTGKLLQDPETSVAAHEASLQITPQQPNPPLPPPGEKAVMAPSHLGPQLWEGDCSPLQTSPWIWRPRHCKPKKRKPGFSRPSPPTRVQGSTAGEPDQPRKKKRMLGDSRHQASAGVEHAAFQGPVSPLSLAPSMVEQLTLPSTSQPMDQDAPSMLQAPSTDPSPAEWSVTMAQMAGMAATIQQSLTV